MNLNLTGNHLEITPAIRDYVVAKLERLTRHFDHVIDVNVVLSVNKLRQKIEANLHIRGKDLHAESIEPDMYAAIDALADKLGRTLLKAKRDQARPGRVVARNGGPGRVGGHAPRVESPVRPAPPADRRLRGPPVAFGRRSAP